MRRALVCAALLLASCSTAPAEPPVHGETPGRQCRSTDLNRFTGQPATSEVGGAILRESHAAVLRWVPHGAMITMEFRADRVTVSLTSDNRIEHVSCG
jgi:hypothetical protein